MCFHLNILLILNRNWSPVMLGGILIIAMAFYVLKGRHEYEGPVVKVHRVE